MSNFTGVHKDNPFNSTDFTDCCGVAVIDEQSCPRCKKTVLRYKHYNPRELSVDDSEHGLNIIQEDITKFESELEKLRGYISDAGEKL